MTPARSASRTLCASSSRRIICEAQTPNLSASAASCRFLLPRYAQPSGQRGTDLSTSSPGGEQLGSAKSAGVVMCIPWSSPSAKLSALPATSLRPNVATARPWPFSRAALTNSLRASRSTKVSAPTGTVCSGASWNVAHMCSFEMVLSKSRTTRRCRPPVRLAALRARRATASAASSLPRRSSARWTRACLTPATCATARAARSARLLLCATADSRMDVASSAWRPCSGELCASSNPLPGRATVAATCELGQRRFRGGSSIEAAWGEADGTLLSA
mmetsp:Transcript_41085/g.129378  ORF Transcript_41085/g.129378 Transcript_41085/m.129378 type:complete len:275 (-) Transcript_41085:25-849(-)